MNTAKKAPTPKQAKAKAKGERAVPVTATPVDAMAIVATVLREQHSDGGDDGGKVAAHNTLRGLTGEQFAVCVAAFKSANGGQCGADEKKSIRNAAKALAKAEIGNAIDRADIARLGKKRIKWDDGVGEYAQSQGAELVNQQGKAKQAADARWFLFRAWQKLAETGEALANTREGSDEHALALDKNAKAAKAHAKALERATLSKVNDVVIAKYATA